jgi:hypothetical protein
MSRKKEDQLRIDKIHDLPCVACASMKVSQPFNTEAHHIVSHGYRRLSGGDQSTIPLDAWHHRGICLPGTNARQMAEKYGPSLALSKREFVKVFGTELELLDKTNGDLLYT